MEALLQTAEAAGFSKLVLRVFVENEASRALLRAVGFREVGAYHRHGKLEGARKYVVMVERLLSPA
ncbi:GNAT family N-acetyltransferase [Pyxidicoccus sp. MSG2]|uniref:GNAT family N-acetyltransferase n=1 Tax=Pyxidicoccus sp. MSG2 TaxID=2996790 RepID=UPI002271123B|nr:hypothetical protein [Pyxidicoccus sp. MSG2]MCY1023992.1 hypothetical protein [Pyxidicoccus sp. MSG2]